MPYEVEIDAVDENEWARLLPLFEDATIYQSWAYAQIRWGAKQVSHLVLREGSTVVAMAQLRVVTLPIPNTGVAYVRWGPLWRRRGSPASFKVFYRMMSALIEEYAKRRGLLLRVIPHAYTGDAEEAEVSNCLKDLSFRTAETVPAYTTVRVDLRPTLEELRARLHRKWRNHLNSAERGGLSIVERTDNDSFDTFVQLYGELLARKRFNSNVDVEQFRLIQRALPEDLKMRVLLCYKGAEPLSAVVLSAIGGTGIYLLGATGAQGMKDRGAYLLQWQALEWLRSRHCNYYDLGGIDAVENPGVYEFKTRMGGPGVRQLPAVEFGGNLLSNTLMGLAERLTLRQI